jgi:hypothetical protein
MSYSFIEEGWNMANKNKDVKDQILDLENKLSAAKNDEEATKYLKKLAKLNPDNIDYERQLLLASSKEDIREDLQELKKKAIKQIKDKKWATDEDIGDYWLILETRPLMMIMEEIFQEDVENQDLDSAIKEGEEMLRLCKGDNLGIRDQLAILYFVKGDKRKQTLLQERYKDSESLSFTLVNDIYRYEKNPKLKESILNELAARNIYLLLFLEDILITDNDMRFDIMASGTFEPYSLEEAFLQVLFTLNKATTRNKFNKLSGNLFKNNDHFAAFMKRFTPIDCLALSYFSPENTAPVSEKALTEWVLGQLGDGTFPTETKSTLQKEVVDSLELLEAFKAIHCEAKDGSNYYMISYGGIALADSFFAIVEKENKELDKKEKLEKRVYQA